MSATTSIEWTDTLRARFWSYVEKQGPGECWPWRGGLFTNGYGQFRLGKRKIKAHRAAYELTHGPIPNGLIGRHTCDNPPCCNPAHVATGTHADNSRDRVERGRSARLFGTSNPQARLTPDVIGEIKARAAAGETYRAIGTAIGIHYNHVGRIVRGERWA